jgi:hypothetical protein
MKSTYSFSSSEARSEGRKSVYLYLLIIAAILALMILSEFGSKFIK